MSFESVYRSKTGVTELNKVATMIGSLVIKNQYEAQLYETSQSLSNYIKYQIHKAIESISDTRKLKIILQFILGIKGE